MASAHASLQDQFQSFMQAMRQAFPDSHIFVLSFHDHPGLSADARYQELNTALLQLFSAQVNTTVFQVPCLQAQDYYDGAHVTDASQYNIARSLIEQFVDFSFQAI